MPKLSIYVSDQLWNTVRPLFGEDVAASTIVQTGLQRLLNQERGAVWEGLRDDQYERVFQLQDRLREEAEQLFGRGYDLGLALVAEILNFNALDYVINGAQGRRVLERMDDLMNVADDLGDDAVAAYRTWWQVLGSMDPMTEAGVWRALTDLWSSIARRTPPAKPGIELLDRDTVKKNEENLRDLRQLWRELVTQAPDLGTTPSFEKMALDLLEANQEEKKKKKQP